MTLLQFSQRLNLINEKSALIEAIVSFINTPPSTPEDTKKLQAFVESISGDEFTSFGQNLGFCRSYCIEELEKEGNQSETTYIEKLTCVKNLLDLLSKVYQEINEQREAAKVQYDESYTLAQQKDVLRELKAQTKELKKDIDKANHDIAKANESLDSKIFSLLINTVAVLGIFVAIAFTGFGVVSIFSNIDLKIALSSEEAFVKNIFFMFLVSFFIYNLLLLLVYFIFKLSRPMPRLKREPNAEAPENQGEVTFKNAINLVPFLWVDGILGVLTAAAFVVSILIW